MSTPSSSDPAAAVLDAGERVLAALAADDVEGALAAAQEREASVQRLLKTSPSPDPAQAAQFARQSEALADQLQSAHSTLAEALRQVGRVQHAATRYTTGRPSHSRLQARG